MGKTTAQRDAHAVKDGIGQKDVYVIAVGDTTKPFFSPSSVLLGVLSSFLRGMRCPALWVPVCTGWNSNTIREKQKALGCGADRDVVLQTARKVPSYAQKVYCVIVQHHTGWAHNDLSSGKPWGPRIEYPGNAFVQARDTRTTAMNESREDPGSILKGLDNLWWGQFMSFCHQIMVIIMVSFTYLLGSNFFFSPRICVCW